MKKIVYLSVLTLSLFTLSGCSDKKENANQNTENKISENISVNENDMANGGSTNIKAEPFKYKKEKQLVMKPLDKYKRAVDSHIQVSKSQLPKNDRDSRLTYNPSGWHNYKVKDKEGKSYWAYNRGHLVGYQFCGLNSEPRNLVTETRTLNAGAGRGTDQNNPISQLYYEQRLRKFVEQNPDKRLDLQVTPLYKNNELMPRSVRMSFVGYDKKGKQVKIKLDSNNKYVKYKGQIGQVILPNVEPTLDIDYKTGTAKVLDKKQVDYNFAQTSRQNSGSFVPYWLAYNVYRDVRDSRRYHNIQKAIKEQKNVKDFNTTSTKNQTKNNNVGKTKTKNTSTKSTKSNSSSLKTKINDIKKAPTTKAKTSTFKSNSSFKSFKSTPKTFKSAPTRSFSGRVRVK